MQINPTNMKFGGTSVADAGAHLGNLPLVQDESADHLHIEVTHAGRADAGFAHYRKCFRQDFIQNLLLGRFAMIFVAGVFDGVLNLRFEIA